ncbi:HAD family hydrolase [Geomicrobium sp. JCM 19038]|uniref:HAD family hydrolase n=1 Tax=Geomicrobium sp. JCM 19038 TaxID=1460635 RepID=UPI00045F4887|nr:HAD family hydrolase [Geomicrobium sp. JCM 19038]GAK08159.1 5'-methylthioadenosine nucleosidase [Geomicrobium sp. JCM 19038]
MDSIIFDLDGTLWDSSDVVVNTWQSKLSYDSRIKQTITKEDLQGVMGLQMEEIGERLFPNLTSEERETLLKQVSNAENEALRQQGGRLYEHVESTLEQLASRYQLYIVSNCQDGYIEAFYHYHNLGKYFRDYENPGRTGLSKAENIQLVISRNQLNASVYVGDTLGDQEAAKKAGIPFIYASYGFGDVKTYDKMIHQPKELLQIL